MKYLLALVPALMLTGCGECNSCQAKHERPQIMTRIQAGSNSNDLLRFEDKEMGILCYKVSGYEGLSCIRKVAPVAP